MCWQFKSYLFGMSFGRNYIQIERIGTHVTHTSRIHVVFQHAPAWSPQVQYPPDKPCFSTSLITNYPPQSCSQAYKDLPTLCMSSCQMLSLPAIHSASLHRISSSWPTAKYFGVVDTINSSRAIGAKSLGGSFVRRHKRAPWEINRKLESIVCMTLHDLSCPGVCLSAQAIQ